MNWENPTSLELEIRDMKKTIQGSEIHISWFWPREVDYVYIYRAPSDNLRPISEITESDLLFYTREEYKANHGYIGRIDAVGRYALRVFPCQKQDGKLVVFGQENNKNLVYLTGSKAKIYFSITYKNKLFQPVKKVRMSIMSELSLNKDLLVYVRKKGSVPVSIADGTVYPFPNDFAAGESVQPEIEIGRNEFVRIFFKNGSTSAQIYDLIPQ